MSVVAVVAGVTFGGAIALLAAFFATKVERYDRIAEWSFVVFGACAVPTIVTVGGRLPVGSTVGTVVTVIGAAGAAAIGLGELGSSLHLVDFRKISALITLAFVAFLLWIGAVSVITLASGGLPIGLGWLGLVSIILGVGIIGSLARVPGVLTGVAEPPRAQMVAFFVPMLGIVGWMVWLGLSL